MTIKGHDSHLGAMNLLANCARMKSGERLLIVAEDPAHGYYGAGLAGAVEDAARQMGLDVTTMTVAFHADARSESDQVLETMGTYDRTVFLARIGDQMRFSASMAPASAVVSYALDEQMLGSAFGQLDHAGLLALRDVVNSALSNAEIRITCRLGTDISGRAPQLTESGDTSIVRFPLSVFTPVPAETFSGRILQAGFLVGTGSSYYDPYGVALHEPLTIQVESGRITGFDGSARDVQAAKDHYRFVAETFGIDPWLIHSWHAGIHPGCGFTDPASASLERWSGGAFGNPRVLHFHTCGDYPPGEISVNIVDCTVSVDGVPVWEDGRLWPDRIAGGAAILAQHADLAALFEAPATEIGLGPNGQLSLLEEFVL